MAGKTDWSDSYQSDVSQTIENDLIPELGKMPIRAIQAAHLLTALRKIEARGASTVAARAQFLSSEIWRHATCTLRADSDLAAGLRGAIRMPASQNHPALKQPEIPAFLATFERYPGRNETRLALRLMLMLFPRPNELLGAPWSDLNLDAAEWRIAAVRMKGREDHVIPLPTQAVEILRALQHITGNRVHVFPHRDKRDDCMTDAALRAALRLIGYGGKLTPHGLRATAATPLSELGV
jgi:integrase